MALARDPGHAAARALEALARHFALSGKTPPGTVAGLAACARALAPAA